MHKSKGFENLNYNRTLKKLSENGLLLEVLAEEKQTEEVCLTAVKSNGLALAYVLPKFKTETIVEAAVRNNANAIEYANFKSDRLIKLAFRQNPNIDAKLIA